ncbi:hypothetical protein LTR78_003980 [Recurvomyces mirabilis]|uniref:Peroxin 26 n=2 Tax=Recurvomyces mirabilis TaxID=574656 RepID=A0AAE0WQU6_9PEZI|nr:hypothetical protein LTR78_003980 [Recurvomyces mirabilis]
MNDSSASSLETASWLKQVSDLPTIDDSSKHFSNAFLRVIYTLWARAPNLGLSHLAIRISRVQPSRLDGRRASIWSKTRLATMATTLTSTYQDTQYISSSISSLSRSRSTNSLIVRTYKEATQLYLTKRFKEALETLEPIISAPRPDEPQNGESNGISAAPIAQSSKGTRTKVWVFYLSLLHAIVELGAEEGKLIFGSARWRQLAARAREGSVWEEIVKAGYAGEEGEVDADVVVNLATLLLGHMSHQKLTQQKLEAWLTTTSDMGGQHVSFADGTMSPAPNGNAGPKALATRLKILELYALHVLPANGEWEYAQQFIELNDSLDEERKEAFSHALQELREEKDGTAQRERELNEQREREMEERRLEEERQRVEQEREAEEKRKQVEQERVAKPMKDSGNAKPTANSSAGSAKPPANGTTKPAPSPTSRIPPARNPRKPPPPPPTTLYRRATSALGDFQQMVLQASRNMTGGGRFSFAAFRFLMFLVAFLVVVARRDVRVRLRRLMGNGWGKVRKTVGMGVKLWQWQPNLCRVEASATEEDGTLSRGLSEAKKQSFHSSRTSGYS